MRNPEQLKNVLVVPPRFYGKVLVDSYVKDTEILWVDSEGRVHRFEYMGRLIDENSVVE